MEVVQTRPLWSVDQAALAYISGLVLPRLLLNGWHYTIVPFVRVDFDVPVLRMTL